MTIRALPTIKRFFQSTTDAIFGSSSNSSSLRRGHDFMIHDATSVGRFYGR
jgi:hypothetical protein